VRESIFVTILEANLKINNDVTSTFLPHLFLEPFEPPQYNGRLNLIVRYIARPFAVLLMSQYPYKNHE